MEFSNIQPPISQQYSRKQLNDKQNMQYISLPTQDVDPRNMPIDLDSSVGARLTFDEGNLLSEARERLQQLGHLMTKVVRWYKVVLMNIHHYQSQVGRLI